MTFLSKERNKKSYFEKISTKSDSMQYSTKIALDHFEKFCEIEYKHDSEQVIKELLEMKNIEDEQIICDMYQSWINWSSEKGISPNTLKVYFSLLKSYIHYRGIKIADKDVKDNLNFPKIIKEEKQPLLSEHIQKILKIATFSKQGLYLALLSSGMRIGESAQIREKHIELVDKHMLIHIPAKITKTKEGRSVFISKEASSFLTAKLNRINDDELVWGTNEDPKLAVLAEVGTFQNYVDKLGLCDRYDSGTQKITLHSFRAYFFTKAARCHDENYAHKMTGHGGYLMQYDRLTHDEKLEMYLELEPNLLIHDQTKNEEKIRKLKQDNSKIIKQQESFEQYKIEQQEKMEKMQAQMDRLLHTAQSSGMVRQIKTSG